MAANAWELYIISQKYVVNTVTWVRTGEKPAAFIFDIEPDLEFYKKLSLILTVTFLIPVIIVMIRKIDAHNFCKFLALTNLIAFNFGFHVHEKAMLLCLIPLGLMVYQQRDHESVYQADQQALKT